MSEPGDSLARGREAALAGDLRTAAACFREAARLAPLTVRAWHNLALVGLRGGDRALAGAALRRRLVLEPGAGIGWRLAADLEASARPEAAFGLLRRAVCGSSAPHAALVLVAARRHQEGRLDEAERLYRRALVADPGDLETLVNHGALLNDLGRGADASRTACRAIALAPGDARTRGLKGWVGLGSGYWAALDDYAARWEDPEPGSRARLIGAPLWRGAPCDRLSLYGQFGIGDEILFASIVSDAAARARRTILEADPRLVGLFGRALPNVVVVARSDPPDRLLATADAQASTAYLPAVLRRGPETFPSRPGFLRAEPERVAAWRSRFAALGPAPHLGLAWRGGVARTGDRKSTTLSALSPALRDALSGATLISLQYGEDPDERAAARAAGALLPHPNPADDIRDDIETLAAQIAALDAVVSISGLTAHLAGALGRPGVVILPEHPLWFWFDQGERTPFYPSLRLVRMRDGRLPDGLASAIADVLNAAAGGRRWI